MPGKTERIVNRRGVGAGKRKGEQDSVAECVMKAGGEMTPLLVDANQGAKMLGVSLSTFYKVMRKSENAPMIQLGSLQRWRKKDLLRFTGTAFHYTIVEDFLIDTEAAAILCAVSRSMFYKMNQLGATPKAVSDGRTLRWNCRETADWIEAGCPNYGKKSRRGEK